MSIHLKLRQLEVFRALAEEGTVSAAARRLNVTQPAVSTAVLTLENAVGFDLFARRDGAFVLTPEGRLFHAESEQALIAADRVEVLARHIRDGERGVIRVSAFGAASIVLMPSVIAEFSRERPGVDVELQVRDSAQVQKFVGDGQADLGVIEGIGTSSRVSAESFAVDCVCIMPEDHPLAVLETITPWYLAGHRMIGVSDNHSVDEQVARAFANAGIDLNMPLKGYLFAAMRTMVRHGAGVAIVDAINGKTDLGDGVVWRPFEPTVRYEMSIIRSASLELHGPARDLHDRLISRLSEFRDE